MIRVVAGLVALVLASPASADPKTSEPPNVGQLADFALDLEAPQFEDGAAIVAWFQAHLDGVVLVHGHADASGRGDCRRAFARARLVREHLIKLGIDPDHIVTAAYATPDGKVIVWGATNRSGSVATP